MYILWPSYRPNGDPLLYLTGQPLIEGKGRCAFVADVNPYGVEVELYFEKMSISEMAFRFLYVFLLINRMRC